MFGNCKGCKKSRIIVNIKYKLCDDCNCIRLHGVDRKTRTLQLAKINEERKKDTIKATGYDRDKRWYEYQFLNRPPVCEECGKSLNVVFENNGKIIYVWQYSHIITKGSRQDLRYHKLNCNRLCFDHHTQWETGDRKSMKIYPVNQMTIKLIHTNKNNLVL